MTEGRKTEVRKKERKKENRKKDGREEGIRKQRNSCGNFRLGSPIFCLLSKN